MLPRPPGVRARVPDRPPLSRHPHAEREAARPGRARKCASGAFVGGCRPQVRPPGIPRHPAQRLRVPVRRAPPGARPLPRPLPRTCSFWVLSQEELALRMHKRIRELMFCLLWFNLCAESILKNFSVRPCLKCRDDNVLVPQGLQSRRHPGGPAASHRTAGPQQRPQLHRRCPPSPPAWSRAGVSARHP